ncbi:nitroreductase family protein [Latilactobacillus sakei]|uniref:nitroreductase family protein n=1 Tax=Latilactobacillus sakei TaxID=1599 RepID=UPI0009755C31|nr:nitroreductase family protein [Latilactobacillus sakei]MCM1635313.1 nitroreductase family protein [Latilactobacillus sakei]PKX60437.1 nitroreductase [Latilactobacillus sakei]PKX69261.1 nitroreductase [Latilactobacillus sakei]RFN55762.1 nitroreductase [Latilactobacillus sakei]UNC18455.1 nitroreductase family protein [Latilactobacillus sakei]
MTNLFDLQQQRRSIYALGQNIDLTEAEVSELIFKTIKETPSAFNGQGSRAVILFGEANNTLWNDITASALKPLTPAEYFPNTQAKLASFAGGVGTILFFEDQDVIKGFQENVPLYAENFPVWAEQSNGMAQYATWMALAEQNIGANLQHYNPVIDEAVAAKWNIPSNWKLRAQMPFGSIENPADAKEYATVEDRFTTYNK